MKVVVAAFNQGKALVGSRGLLRDFEPLDGPSFQSLVCSSFQLEAHVVWVQYLALVLMDILSAIVSTDSI